jgi:hypothetical protein
MFRRQGSKGERNVSQTNKLWRVQCSTDHKPWRVECCTGRVPCYRHRERKTGRHQFLNLEVMLSSGGSAAVCTGRTQAVAIRVAIKMQLRGVFSDEAGICCDCSPQNSGPSGSLPKTHCVGLIEVLRLH